MHEPPAAIVDLAVLPGVRGSRTLRRTGQVRLRSESLWLPGGTAISVISRRRLVHNAGSPSLPTDSHCNSEAKVERGWVGDGEYALCLTEHVN